MKKIFFLSAAMVAFSAIAQKQKTSPVDSVRIMFDGTVVEYHGSIPNIIGKVPTKYEYVHSDDLGNVYAGKNGTVVNGLNNYLGGDNIIVRNGSGNFVQANHGIIDSCHNVSMTGADHHVRKLGHPDGANYADISGDANDVGGYASTTSGGGNINNVEYGVVNGYGNRNGKPGTANEFHSSSISGTYCISEGNFNDVRGQYLRAIGNNISIIGSGKSMLQPFTATQPGFYYVINGIVLIEQH